MTLLNSALSEPSLSRAAQSFKALRLSSRAFRASCSYERARSIARRRSSGKGRRVGCRTDPKSPTVLSTSPTWISSGGRTFGQFSPTSFGYVTGSAPTASTLRESHGRQGPGPGKQSSQIRIAEIPLRRDRCLGRPTAFFAFLRTISSPNTLIGPLFRIPRLCDTE